MSLKDTTSSHNGGGAHNGAMNPASTTVNQNNDEAAAAAFAISGSANGAQGSVQWVILIHTYRTTSFAEGETFPMTEYQEVIIIHPYSYYDNFF